MDQQQNRHIKIKHNWIKRGVYLALLVLLPTLVSAEEFDQENSSIDINQFSQSGSGFFGLVEQEAEGPVNARNVRESLRLLEFGFGDLGNDYTAAEEAGITDQLDPDADIEPAVYGEPLIYPSPYSIRQHPQATLAYELSKGMEVVVRLYNMTGNLIFQRTFVKNSEGGSGKYNKIEFDKTTFSGNDLSAGVYFYYISYNDKVLAKGKWAVVP